MATEILERVACEYLDALQCLCGNATHVDGFDTCTPEGVLCEPDGDWTGIVRCLTCGRLYDTTTFDGATVAVVKGPDLSCRDCGLGAFVKVDGSIKGERDVDPCPAGTDDFHHWTGVARTTCTNATHDHDAINSTNGRLDPDTNVCNGCSRLAHYDRTQEWYFHNDPTADGCFLAGPNVENPCVTA